MIAEELLKKIKRLEIISRKEARDLFAGEYHSAFKGRGIEFSEVREYQAGDDVRSIDWNVSSRMGKLFVKQFIEERELTVILAIDLSASLNFYSQTKSKKEIAAELSALIAFTALLNNDKVGLLIFTDRIERFIPPRKGKVHLLRLIRDILNFTPVGKGTSISNGLIYLNRAIKKKAVVFLISDFLDEGFTTPLKISSRKHDLIAIHIGDPRESQPAEKGLFYLRDFESAEDFMVDFGSDQTRRAFQDERRRRLTAFQELIKKYRIDFLTVDQERDYEKPLFDLFKKRRKKFSR